MRSLQDRIVFIINIYQQHNTFIQYVNFVPLKRNLKYIRVVEVLVVLIWVGGRETIISKVRSFVLLQLVTNVASIEYT